MRIFSGIEKEPREYMQCLDRFDFSDLTFPVCSLTIQKFEKRNKFLSVFAHIYTSKGPECIYTTSFSQRLNVVHLLCLNNHWIPITNLTGFYRQGRAGMYHKCKKCMKSFFHENSYEKHRQVC